MMAGEVMMSKPVVYLASDHAGFSVKADVLEHLKTLGLQIEDLGPASDERVDYPDFADEVAKRVQGSSFGVLICGSGQGMAMRANKYPHIRAALCWDETSAKLARQHNDANVLCFGARLIEKPMILKMITSFFEAQFEGGRHQNRVEKISASLHELT